MLPETSCHRELLELRIRAEQLLCNSVWNSVPLDCVGQNLERRQSQLFSNVIHKIQLYITFLGGNLFL